MLSAAKWLKAAVLSTGADPIPGKRPLSWYSWVRGKELHLRPSGYEPDVLLLHHPAIWLSAR